MLIKNPSQPYKCKKCGKKKWFKHTPGFLSGKCSEEEKKTWNEICPADGTPHEWKAEPNFLL